MLHRLGGGPLSAVGEGGWRPWAGLGIGDDGHDKITG